MEFEVANLDLKPVMEKENRMDGARNVSSYKYCFFVRRDTLPLFLNPGVAAVLFVTAETAVLVRALQAGVQRYDFVPLIL